MIMKHMTAIYIEYKNAYNEASSKYNPFKMHSFEKQLETTFSFLDYGTVEEFKYSILYSYNFDSQVHVELLRHLYRKYAEAIKILRG